MTAALDNVPASLLSTVLLQLNVLRLSIRGTCPQPGPLFAIPFPPILEPGNHLRRYLSFHGVRRSDEGLERYLLKPVRITSTNKKSKSTHMLGLHIFLHS